MRAHLLHKHPSLSLVGRGNSQLACGLKVSTITQPTLASSWAAKAAKPLAQSKQEEKTQNIALMYVCCGCAANEHSRWGRA